MSDTPSFTKELWSRGLSLDDAAHHIAPQQLLDLLEKPYPEISRPPQMELPDDSGWLLRTLAATAAISAALKPVFEHYDDRAAVLDEIRENLLVRIESGEFIALGYSLPRKHGDFPVEIPIDLWEGETDWTNSGISGNGLAYSAVRIIPAKCLAKSPGIIAPPEIAALPAISSSAHAQKPGRPSMRKFIEIAYEELKKSGKVDFRGMQTVATRQIRQAVMTRFPGDAKGTRGLGDEAIRKVISTDFRREREAAESTRNL